MGFVLTYLSYMHSQTTEIDKKKRHKDIKKWYSAVLKEARDSQHLFFCFSSAASSIHLYLLLLLSFRSDS